MESAGHEPDFAELQSSVGDRGDRKHRVLWSLSVQRSGAAGKLERESGGGWMKTTPQAVDESVFEVNQFYLDDERRNYRLSCAVNIQL